MSHFYSSAGTPQFLPNVDPGQQPIFSGTCLTKDEERTIHYHIFELDIREAQLDDTWYVSVALARSFASYPHAIISPFRLEQSQRKREWVTVDEALRRCEEWTYKKNSKIELAQALRRCRVYQDANGSAGIAG
jgi:hypothetical protein